MAGSRSSAREREITLSPYFPATPTCSPLGFLSTTSSSLGTSGLNPSCRSNSGLVPREGNHWLGLFEIVGRVCDDPYRPFDITADLVLEALQESLDYYVPVRLSSYDVHGLVAESPAHAPTDYWVRLYVLASPGGEVYRRIGARLLQECILCRMLMVHPGPNICAAHA
ncbi:hypothetical protein C8J57DRAFT_1275743 [Mycena rebaudengoi]|nr:hypothetical protein C8J57DRAFT_1275743 [Mycena rebaudengoi]